MSVLTAADRVALLRGLAVVIERFRDDTVAGGLEAVRLLRLASASWLDLLPGPAYAADDYALELVGAGYRTMPQPTDRGRAIRSLIHHATPYRLAEAAVLVNRADPSFDDVERLAGIVRQLLAARRLQASHTGEMSAQRGVI